MIKKNLIFCLSVLLLLVSAATSFAAEVNILQYPKTVSPGQTMNVKVNWKDFPIDKNYVLRVQLEDKEVNPPIFLFKDIDVTKQEGQAEAAIAVPNTVVGTKTAKYVAAFISKTKNWDDVLISAETDQNIEIISDFKFEITDFPTIIKKDSTVNVKISWKRVAASNKDYKLIVQLENWDVKPGFAYVARIDDFKPDGEVVLSIRVPSGAAPTKGCRFVAAFISKTKNWDDAYAVVATPKEVEITKYKLI